MLQSTFVALLCAHAAATVAAQTTKPEQKTTTIVGCLVQGNPNVVAGDRRSQTAATNAHDYFVRTPTVAVPAGATIAVGTPGTTSTRPSDGTPTTDSLYRIMGFERDKLQPHLGHRVELQGHLMPTTPNDANTRTTAKTTVDASGRATTRVESHHDVVGELHVTALKMLSATCP
jgi:hypothetical protein